MQTGPGASAISNDDGNYMTLVMVNMASNAEQSDQKKTFTCNARITQDQDGNVTEVELMQCDGSMDWQMSLVNAIQRASPLPAPPSQSVFTNVLTMSFEGRAYVPGSREDEYEPSSAAVARATLER